ncbi:MAG: TSUP family transporter, partial [Hyphomicrobium sp.]
MDIYLPIAEISQNIFVLLAAGGLVGFLSGAFGVGGGFLLTPLLLFLGIPAPVAVASGANQVVGASVSGVIGPWKRGNVDVKMGLVLVAGGFLGSSLGVMLFRWLRALGYIDVTIGVAYVLLLGTVGVFMLIESAKLLVAKR